MKLIDLHTHILPGFDDGPETAAESIEMARAYVEAGYAAVVATPHVIPGVYEHTRTSILRGVRRLEQHLHDAGIPLSVLPGAEYHLTDRLVPLLREGELLTLNDTGKYLLVELPWVDVPPYASQILFELLLAGVTPVIAHPERNGFFAGRPKALSELCARGICAQVTAGALTGLFGRTQKRAAEQFIKQETAQFVATDAHGPGRRLEAGAQVQAQASRLLGAAAQALLYANPALVTSGASLEAAACREAAPKRSSWFDSIRRKQQKS
ncbi:MAG TPA: phosphotransferase [Desulfotomaculum sp.]|nr:phosphotransferase [Desulfotomaculum sp.]